TDEMPARFIRQEQHRPVHVLVGVCVCPEPTVNASVGLDDELVSAVLPLDVDHFGGLIDSRASPVDPDAYVGRAPRVIVSRKSREVTPIELASLGVVALRNSVQRQVAKRAVSAELLSPSLDVRVGAVFPRLRLVELKEVVKVPDRREVGSMERDF